MFVHVERIRLIDEHCPKKRYKEIQTNLDFNQLDIKALEDEAKTRKWKKIQTNPKTWVFGFDPKSVILINYYPKFCWFRLLI